MGHGDERRQWAGKGVCWTAHHRVRYRPRYTERVVPAYYRILNQLHFGPISCLRRRDGGRRAARRIGVLHGARPWRPADGTNRWTASGYSGRPGISLADRPAVDLAVRHRHASSKFELPWLSSLSRLALDHQKRGVVAPDPARGAHSPATMGPWRVLVGRGWTTSPSMPPPPSSIARIYTLQCCLRLLERRVRSQELNGDPSFKAKAGHRSASAWGCLLQLQLVNNVIAL